MVPITALLLPILLAAVLVFVASSIIHMFLPYHRSDYGRVPDEDRLMAEMRAIGVTPGDYAIPHAGSPKAMSEPPYQEKFKQGPVALISVAPGGVASMGKPLALWFGYAVLISVVAAYLTGRTLSVDADYLSVFRVSGTVAFAAYSLGIWPMSIWFHRAWSTTFKSTFDGLIYALLTAGAFGWLWP